MFQIRIIKCFSDTFVWIVHTNSHSTYSQQNFSPLPPTSEQCTLSNVILTIIGGSITVFVIHKRNLCSIFMQSASSLISPSLATFKNNLFLSILSHYHTEQPLNSWSHSFKFIARTADKLIYLKHKSGQVTALFNAYQPKSNRKLLSTVAILTQVFCKFFTFSTYLHKLDFLNQQNTAD